MTSIYPKSSFDRFGDDLLEVLLSYIPFEDCFHFRCVSKQWKRLIFNKQNKLIIDNNSKIKFIKENNENKFKTIEVILKNCPNIRSVVIDYNCRPFADIVNEVNEVFELIIKYCNNLYEIQYSFGILFVLVADKRNRFYDKFGSKLRKIDFCDIVSNNRLLTDVIKCCPNLTHISVYSLNCFFDANQVLCQKLKSIEFRYCIEDTARIDSLIESNKNSLESLKIVVNYNVIENDLIVLFKSIRKLTKLKSFKMKYFTIYDNYILFIDLLEELAKNCKLLEKLKLNLNLITTKELATKLFNAIKKFETLTRLSLISTGIEEKFRKILLSKELKELKNLQHLELRNCCRIANTFFNSIDEHLPQLQTIECDINLYEMTEKTFQSLSLLRSLQKIKFDFNYPTLNFNELDIKQFIENSPKIDSIIFHLKNGLNEKIELNEENIFKIRNGFPINITIPISDENRHRIDSRPDIDWKTISQLKLLLESTAVSVGGQVRKDRGIKMKEALKLTDINGIRV